MVSTGIRPGAGDGKKSPLMRKARGRRPPVSSRLLYPAILLLLVLGIAFALH